MAAGPRHLRTLEPALEHRAVGKLRRRQVPVHQDPVGDLRTGRAPLLQPPTNLLFTQRDVETFVLAVDRHEIVVFNDGKRSPDLSLGGDVADAQSSFGRAAEDDDLAQGIEVQVVDRSLLFSSPMPSLSTIASSSGMETGISMIPLLDRGITG